MSASSRKTILGNIRRALQRSELTDEQKEALNHRLMHRPRGVLPVLSQEYKLLFIEKAQKSLANVECISSLAEVPHFILSLSSHARIAADLSSIPWTSCPDLTIQQGAAVDSDKVSVTTCLCGVAETGTLVLLSSEESPTTLNFLPEKQVVLLMTKNIVSHYEEAWDWIRAKRVNPRTVNFITGPSRTGDIEQKIEMGIHGPKQLYILLYDED